MESYRKRFIFYILVKMVSKIVIQVYENKILSCIKPTGIQVSLSAYILSNFKNGQESFYTS